MFLSQDFIDRFTIVPPPNFTRITRTIRGEKKINGNKMLYIWEKMKDKRQNVMDVTSIEKSL